MEDNQTLWFVWDYYIFSGMTKTEEALMVYARKYCLNTLIRQEDFNKVWAHLETKQGEILAEHKNWKHVRISLQVPRPNDARPDMATLYVGKANLRLRRVKQYLTF